MSMTAKKVRILGMQMFLLLSSSLLPSIQPFLLPATCNSRGSPFPQRIALQLSTTITPTKRPAMVSDKKINDESKGTFSFAQRIESTKSAIVGLFTGGIALAPISALHNLLFPYDGPMRTLTHNLAQFEFDSDVGSLEAALFAIVYRYCLRKGDDDNPQLNQGVIAAFAVTRTLSKIQVPGYCSAVPLNCGSPLGYLDWAMIGQGALSGVESLALFGAAAASMDYCFQRGWISKCP